MAKEISPVVPALPPTTAIQDPAVRNFCRAVADALKSIQSPESSVAALTQALESVAGGSSGPATTVGGNSGQYGVPQFTVNSILRSRLFGALSRTIDRIPLNADGNAEELVAAEASARQAAIDALNARVTSLENADVYDPDTPYNEGDVVQYDGGLYQAKATTTGNLPTNTTYWDKIGDYASIGDAVAALAAEVEEHDTRITNNGTAITAEATSRNTLAVQLRGSYTGTDVAALSQGLIHSERQARVSAVDAVTTTLNTQISRINAAEAAISSEATTRATNDTALMQAINTAWAVTGATSALIQSGGVIQTNWTAGQASQWSQLQAEVFGAGGNTIRAALAEEATVRANVDGSLGAQWTLKTDVDGYISGFGFASTANNATPTSEFIIRADKFMVVMPGYGEHVPFAIGPSGAEFLGQLDWGNVYGSGRPENNATVGATIGVNLGGQITPSNVTTYIANAAIGNAQIANASITNAKIEDGNITTAKIANAAITNAKIGAAEVNTLHLAGNAVTVSSDATGSSTSAPISTTLNIPANQTLRIVAIGFLPGSSGGNVSSHRATVSINGNTLTQSSYASTYITSATGDYNNVVKVVAPMTIVHTLNVFGGASGTTVTVSIQSGNEGIKRIAAFGMLR